MDKPLKMDVWHKSIPQELKDKNQWCVWRWELRDGRWTKPPYSDIGGPAKSNDPTTWTSYKEACSALERGFDGLGFMFTEGNKYVGIDWDKSRDPVTGAPRDWVQRHLKAFDSYTEVSPSGTGFKTIVRGIIPKDHHGDRIGLFSKTRYFCVTGHALPEYSRNLEPRQSELIGLIKEYWPQDLSPIPQTNPGPPAATTTATDEEILTKALDSDDKFRRLFKGNYGDYSSQSEGDLALCSKLAFWLGPDPARIDAMFRRSGLMRPKWDREDYAKRTIERAVSTVQEQYQVKPGNGTGDTAKTTTTAVSSRISDEHIYTPERMVAEYRDYIKSLEKQRFITGIKEVDNVIRGVSGGEVLTILARAGCFKTTMLQHLLMRYAQNSQWTAVFFSLEMPVPSLAERYFQMTAGQPGRAIEDFYKGTRTEDVTQTLEKVFLNDLRGLYVIPVRVSLDDVKGYVKLVESKFQVKVGVIGIDYLGLLDEPGKNEYEIVSRLARDIKGLAKELSLPVVLLSQTSRRAGSGDIEISMDMARGSGAVEESADFCLGIFHAEQTRLSVEMEPQFEVILKILKNRKGPKGLMFKLDLDQETLRLGDTAELWTPPKKAKGNDL